MTREQRELLNMAIDYRAGTEETDKLQIAIEETWKAAMGALKDQVIALRAREWNASPDVKIGDGSVATLNEVLHLITQALAEGKG